MHTPLEAILRKKIYFQSVEYSFGWCLVNSLIAASAIELRQLMLVLQTVEPG